jgi:hypothetical protein
VIEPGNFRAKATATQPLKTLYGFLMLDYRIMSNDELMNTLLTDEDRLPREAVDEFIWRGGSLVHELASIVSASFYWNEPLPRWWAVIHAVYILGAIGTPETVVPLLKALRYAEACENNLVTEELPSIFGRIGTPAVEGLRKIADDWASGWFARAIAFKSLAAVTILYPDCEQKIFRFIRACFCNEREEWRLRKSVGHILLDFLRTEYREDLTAFGRDEKQRCSEDPSYQSAFTDDEVAREFAHGAKSLEPYTHDWLSFYDPEEIAARWKHRKDEKKTSPARGDEFCPFATTKRQKKCCLGRIGAD